MIFLTVGTHPQQFNRLLEKVDELIKRKVISEKVFAQTGHSYYKPKNFEFKEFLGLGEFDELMGKADLIISHGGEGNIGKGLQLGKKMIIVPRLKKFGEHTNDHQLELTEAVEREGRLIAVYEIEKLREAVRKANDFQPKEFAGGKKIIELLNNFVKEKM